MDCVIVYRINGGKVEFVIDDEGDANVWPHKDDAIAYALSNALFQSGQTDFQIVELDEL